MKGRWLTLLATMSACASTDAVLGGYDASSEEPVRTRDAGLTPDAAPVERDAGECDDCEYFPEVCTADTLCQSGLFDPALPGGALDPRTLLLAIRGRSATDVWVAGALGAVAHFDGTSWRRSDLGSPGTVRGLWLLDSAEIAVGLANQVFAEQLVYARGTGAPDGGSPPDGDGWKRFTVQLPSYYPIEIISAWAAPAAGASLWVATESVFDVTGSGVLRLRPSPSGGFELRSGPLSPCEPGCKSMKSLHGSSPDALWAVGANGTALRITNAESEAPSVKIYNTRTWNSLNGVWAASDSDAWAVGANGTIRHFTGHPRDWDIVEDVPTGVELNAIWGASASDVWAVGDAGVVVHYDGTSWSRVKVAGLGARRPQLTTVWVAASGHVWIGGEGILLSLGGKP